MLARLASLRSKVGSTESHPTREPGGDEEFAPWFIGPQFSRNLPGGAQWPDCRLLELTHFWGDQPPGQPLSALVNDARGGES